MSTWVLACCIFCNDPGCVVRLSTKCTSDLLKREKMKESLRLRTVRPSSGPTQICVLFVLLLVLLLCSAGSSCAISIAMVAVNNAIVFDQSIHPIYLWICRATNLPVIFYYAKVLLYMQNFAAFCGVAGSHASFFSMHRMIWQDQISLVW